MQKQFCPNCENEENYTRDSCWHCCERCSYWYAPLGHDDGWFERNAGEQDKRKMKLVKKFFSESYDPEKTILSNIILAEKTWENSK